jgi:hypothetical protein
VTDEQTNRLAAAVVSALASAAIPATGSRLATARVRGRSAAQATSDGRPGNPAGGALFKTENRGPLPADGSSEFRRGGAEDGCRCGGQGVEK